MTLPINPGPFSFIGEIGKGLGELSRSREEKRIRDLEEDRQAANLMLTMRNEGYLTGEDFANPDVQDLFKRSGYPAPSTELTPQEQKAKLTGEYIRATSAPPTPVNIPLQSLGLGMDANINVPATARFTAEQRSLIGAPQQSEIVGEKVNQGVQGQKLGALAQGGAAGRAVAGVQSQPVAQATESGPVAEAFTREAPNFIALSTRGADLKNISPQDFQSYVDAAYQAYVQDAQANNQAVLPEDQAKRYFAGALQSLIHQQQLLDVQRLGAQSRFASSDYELRDIDRVADNYRQQQSIEQASINKLREQLPKGLSESYIRNSPALMQIYGETIKQIDASQAKIDQLEGQITDLSNRSKGGLNARYPERAPGQNLSDKQGMWDQLAEGIRSGASFASNPRRGGETTEQYINRALGPRP